jgi:hypothetical protein
LWVSVRFAAAIEYVQLVVPVAVFEVGVPCQVEPFQYVVFVVSSIWTESEAMPEPPVSSDAVPAIVVHVFDP